MRIWRQPLPAAERRVNQDVTALALDAKFEGLGLGLVDGTVAAVAERQRVYRVLTTDRRDFGTIRVGPRLKRALELLS